MKTPNKSSPRFPLVVSLVVLIGAYFWGPGSVGAVTSEAYITITGGSLTLEDIPDNVTFTGITLTGAEQTELRPLTDLIVTDSRGSGAGWKVEVSASQFVDGALSRTLDTGSLSMYKPDGFTAVPSGGTAPTTNLTDDPYVIDNGSSITIVDAAVDSGLGRWTISWSSNPLLLKINPTTTKIGTYKSTITWQLNEVP